MKSTRTLYSLATMSAVGKVIHDTETGEATIELRRDVAAAEKLVVEPGGPLTWWPGDFGGDVLVVCAADPGDILPPYLPKHVEHCEVLPYGAEHEADVVKRVAREFARYRGGPEHFAIGVWDSSADRMVWRARTWDTDAAG